MKKIKLLFVLCLALISLSNVSAQSTYPFQVTKTGTGEKAILFLPGFTCSAAEWDSTIHVFKNDFTCYTFTMPGFAEVPPEKNPDLNEWTSSIAQFIRDKHLDHPIIIGHSLGGGMALQLAASYPKLPGKIVVVDALPCLAILRNPQFKSEKNPDCTPFIKQIVSPTPEQFRAMQKMTARIMTSDTSRYDQIVNWSMISDRNTMARIYCQFINTDLRDTIKYIQCPALILLESPFKGMKERVEEQYKNLKQADLRYADKGLHFIMYDDPEWYFAQLKSFLKPSNGI